MVQIIEVVDCLHRVAGTAGEDRIGALHLPHLLSHVHHCSHVLQVMDAKFEQLGRGASTVAASETWSRFVLHGSTDQLVVLAAEAVGGVPLSVAWQQRMSWTHLRASTIGFSLPPRGYNVVLYMSALVGPARICQGFA